jgi:hypothetical protein
MTHYVAYLNEFGHVGQYVARNHPKYKTHPAFGFAGLILPATEIREFAIYFYKAKWQLLAYDLANDNPRNLPAYQWKNQGSQFYALCNVTNMSSSVAQRSAS